MGFDVQTFHYLLDNGFGRRWNSQAIPRTDTNLHGAPRPNRRSLDAAGGLGLALHYLSSTMTETSLQQIFALIPSTVSRYINFALETLLKTVEGLPSGQIKFPRQVEELNRLSSIIEARHPLLTGAIGTMDGWKTPIGTARDPEYENATYNGWLHHHFVSNIAIFDAEGAVIAARVNAPGSWHDSRIARPLYDHLLTLPPAFFLIADTAFPRGPAAIQNRIKAPCRAGEALAPRNDGIDPNEFNRQLVSCRQVAEWGMRALQSCFGRLRLPLDVNDAEQRRLVITLCLRLHNIRTRIVGINQIRNVYVPAWENADGYAGLGNVVHDILFRDIQDHDRVARFHVVDPNL